MANTPDYSWPPMETRKVIGKPLTLAEKIVFGHLDDPKRDDLVTFLAGEIRGGDVCISMGCCDIATLPDEVLARRMSAPR